MIIAVTVMNMVQSAINNVVNVVAMWDGFMTTTRAVHMVPAGLDRHTAAGVGSADFDHVFVAVVWCG